MAGEYKPESTRERLGATSEEPERMRFARIAQDQEARQRRIAHEQASSMNAVGGAMPYHDAMLGRLATGTVGSTVAARDVNAVGADYETGALHTMAKDPNKRFKRSDILAILKSQKCLNDGHAIPAMREGGDDVLRSLIRIFENLE
jgi:hypothetical protein